HRRAHSSVVATAVALRTGRASGIADWETGAAGTDQEREVVGASGAADVSPIRISRQAAQPAATAVAWETATSPQRRSGSSTQMSLGERIRFQRSRVTSVTR